jgi:hypothetical protein
MYDDHQSHAGSQEYEPSLAEASPAVVTKHSLAVKFIDSCIQAPDSVTGFNKKGKAFRACSSAVTQLICPGTLMLNLACLSYMGGHRRPLHWLDFVIEQD